MAADPDPTAGHDPTSPSVPERRGPFAETWVKRTAIVVAALLVLGIGAGVWVNQSSAQNDRLDTMVAQQTADKAEAQAKADKAAAEAKTAKDIADAKAAQAAKDLQQQKDLLRDQQILQAQQTADEAQRKADEAQRKADEASNKSTTVIIQPPSYYYGYVPSYPNVWGSYPLISSVTQFVSVRAIPSSSSTAVAKIYVGENVDVVCSVTGENVTTESGNSSSNWDYVRTPAPGWVADAYVTTPGSLVPRC
jgi:hypothetical protein